jgi:hypothetical protein
MTGFKGMNGPKYKEFCEAAEPLMKWIAENRTWDHWAIVGAHYAELCQPISQHKTHKFLKEQGGQDAV